MAPGERRDRDRDRGRDRDRERDDRATAPTDLTALQNDLAKTNQRLEKVAKLSVYTARDVGEMKSHLQIVLFVAGVLRDYVDARDKIQSGVVEKGPPLKCRIYDAVTQYLVEPARQISQECGAKTEELCGFKAQFDVVAVSNCQKPPEDTGRPWVLVVTFAGSDRGRTMRALWGNQALQPLFRKRDGAWPDVGAKAGTYCMGQMTQEVASEAGMDYGKGCGKGKGVRRRSESPSNARSARLRQVLSGARAAVSSACHFLKGTGLVLWPRSLDALHRAKRFGVFHWDWVSSLGFSWVGCRGILSFRSDGALLNARSFG